MGTTIDELLARTAITDVVFRYCRALDRMDRELASTVWHEGGTADYGAYFNGAAELFLDWVWTGHATLDRHAHQVTNLLIEVDGDRAASEAYVTVVLRGDPDGTGQRTFAEIGRYLDTWERRDDRWAIVHRNYVADINDLLSNNPSPITTRARRDTSDPSYLVLGMESGQ